MLIVGLGNPGAEYANTRHNLGFLIVEAFAKKKGLVFKRDRLFSGSLARGNQFLLLKPETYMNLSGVSVELLLRKEELAVDRLVVVHDEIAVDLGDFRLKVGGSGGGHNGVQSIIQTLNTGDFIRLRAGIGPFKGSSIGETLSEFVLSPFGENEKELLPSVIEQGALLLEKLQEQTLEQVMKELHSKKVKAKEKGVSEDDSRQRADL